MELGIADHIWLDKRAAIAQTVDELGDNFKPAMRAGSPLGGWRTSARHIQMERLLEESLWARDNWLLIDI